KPKTQRGKRFLEHRESKVIENCKTALLIRGISASGTVVNCLKDIVQLKKPHAVFFNKKNNDSLPFEDITKLEFFSQKNDASLFLMATHNKKRPHNLIMGRMFDHRLLDMIELGLEDYVALKDFHVAKVAAGIKPCLIFTGEAFEQQENYQRLKNLLIDFFHGEEVTAVNLAGLEHVLMFAALDEKIYVRSYKILLKKSGTSTPRIELEEIGPSMALTIRRTKLASPDSYKSATKQPAQTKVKKIKNIKKNPFGTKLGQIHMERQDLNKLQTRKMKGLKGAKGTKRLGGVANKK
uniref:Ribosome production factor 2 homolog n=1 Tax=Strigamia maritima TaxID=126957 RepID=T1IVI4_STRMM